MLPLLCFAPRPYSYPGEKAESAKWVMASNVVNLQQKQKDVSIWAGSDVGKASFSAALDNLMENVRTKITMQPCCDLKRTPKGALSSSFSGLRKSLRDVISGLSWKPPAVIRSI